MPTTPMVVCIGPIAYRPWVQKPLQDYKWCCLRRLVNRHHLLEEPARTPALVLRRCLDTLSKSNLEPRIRASYPRSAQGLERMSGKALLLIMLLDGSFILHRLLKYAHMARREAASDMGSADLEKDDGEDQDDGDWTQLFGRCWVWSFVTYNLLLLQNQIPFFVVEKLFEQLRTDPNESSDVLVAGALRLFRSLRPRTMQRALPIACKDVHHPLHLFFLSVGRPATATAAPGDPRRQAEPPSESPQWVPCARELVEAGVKLRLKQGATSFLDVSSNGGVLEIPLLQLYDYSEPLLHNLIAFEQTYPFTTGDVTAYAIFMDCLVASPEDTRLLQLSGVLVNQMNGVLDRDADNFFNRLCHQAHIAGDRNYLAGVIADVNRYQRARWPRWRAALVRNYFSNPWVATSVAAAVFLLAL